MRPDYRTFRVNDHYLIGANLGLRVLILRPDARSVAYDVDWQANADDAFSLSEDGTLLAGAFSSESFCCIEVLDVRGNPVVTPESRERATIHRLERIHAYGLRLAPNGDTLFYLKHGTTPGTYAFHLPTAERLQVAKDTSLRGGAWLQQRVILPFRDKRGAVCISYRPIATHRVELPSKVNIWQLTEHPHGDVIAMLDVEGQVASLRADTLEPFWRRRITDAGLITYSGDGRFIAVRQHAPGGGRAERIIILDAVSGEVARTVEEPEEHALFPLDGPRFLCYSGRFLNAETGEFEEGVSRPGFWQELLDRRQ